jgi:RNA polymerase sigma factor (sigma-70 family)
MATGSIHRVIQGLRRAALIQEGIGRSDAELLTCFIEQRDEASFETLLRRHGPMVLGVCRRVLGNHHDVEDAFQATFLVLVSKAASIVPRTMVGNWLHGVANTTAVRARAAIARRRAKETKAARMPPMERMSQDLWEDLLPRLDGELRHLPEKYRVPIILCDLESKSIKEASRQLGWPQGTVAGRLARARALLARRLARHGSDLSTAMLAPLLSRQALASLPASLASSTVKAARLFAATPAPGAGIISPNVLALTEGVLRTMLITRVWIATIMLLGASLIGLGAGFGAHALATQPGAAPAMESKANSPGKDAAPGKEPPPVEKRFKQYQVDIRLVKVDRQGRDLGADGMGKVLAAPTLVVAEGKEAKFASGGEQAVPGDRPGAVEFMDFGLLVRVKVKGLEDGRIRLESALERTQVKHVGPEDVQLDGRITRSIARVKLGEAIKLVEKDDQGKARYWARIQIMTEESIISRTRSANAAVPGPVPVALDFGFPIIKSRQDKRQPVHGLPLSDVLQENGTTSQQLFSFWIGFCH